MSHASDAPPKRIATRFEINDYPLSAIETLLNGTFQRVSILRIAANVSLRFRTIQE